MLVTQPKRIRNQVLARAAAMSNESQEVIDFMHQFRERKSPHNKKALKCGHEILGEKFVCMNFIDTIYVQLYIVYFWFW